MTSPETGPAGTPDDQGVAGPPPRRRRWTRGTAAAAAAVIVAGVVAAVVVWGRSTGTSAAAPAHSTGTSAPTPAPGTTPPATSAVASPTVIPGKEKYLPPPMADAELAATRAELAALAPRLPHLALTAPASWA
jgi:hypothetical protein